MESDKNTPAFPPNAGWRDNAADCRGLTKREWFAGQLMPWALGGLYVDETDNALAKTGADHLAAAAEVAVQAADALIAALETK